MRCDEGCENHESCTYVEEVITGHTRLTGDTGGDDDNVGTLERLSETTIGGEIASDDGGGVDVREIGSDTRSIDAVVLCRGNTRTERWSVTVCVEECVQGAARAYEQDAMDHSLLTHRRGRGR